MPWLPTLFPPVLPTYVQDATRTLPTLVAEGAALYAPVLLFFAVACVLALAMVALPMLLAPRKPDNEKTSPYECGFAPFGDARAPFDIRFYLVSILFIIFDLEIAFLFPWAVALKHIGIYGFWSMMLFLGVLTVGFIYEWRKGALQWE
jgi:NADH-quinone oxidoreductase subunit A